jgi:hypothetical protein
MSRVPKPEWVLALRGLCGAESDIRFNETVGRWEFLLLEADGIVRSQFWGQFSAPIDPVTGMYPFRELDDAGMREALRNLERTYIGNPYDGAGSNRAEVLRRMEFNLGVQQRAFRAAGELYADMWLDRIKRIKGDQSVSVLGSVT